MKKKILLRIILAVWVIIWALFLIRPYFKKGLGGEYITLLTLSDEGKRAFILGNELHRFINFCKGSIGQPSTYEFIGIEEDSIEGRRARYYLYPNVENKAPEFLLVYNTNGFSKEGYKLFKSLDSGNYILRKTR